MKVNLERSRELAKEVVVRKHDCFQNALRALDRCRDAVFVVGVVGDHRYKKEAVHTWLEFEGEILDPTWTTHWAETQPSDVIYQPIRRTPGSEALAQYWHMVSEKMCGVADWDEIISQAEIDEANSAILSHYKKRN